MRFLLDNNLPPSLEQELAAAGHQAVHIRAYGLEAADDEIVLERARSEGRVLVSADTDFGGMLANQRATTPSIILLRRATGRRAGAVAQLIISNLDAISHDLEAGSIVVFTEDAIRIRRLPFAVGD